MENIKKIEVGVSACTTNMKAEMLQFGYTYKWQDGFEYHDFQEMDEFQDDKHLRLFILKLIEIYSIAKLNQILSLDKAEPIVYKHVCIVGVDHSDCMEHSKNNLPYITVHLAYPQSNDSFIGVHFDEVIMTDQAKSNAKCHSIFRRRIQPRGKKNATITHLDSQGNAIDKRPLITF